MWVLLSVMGDEARCVARIRTMARASAVLEGRRAAGDSTCRLYRAAEGAAPPLDETASLARWAIRIISGSVDGRPPEEHALLLALATAVQSFYVGSSSAIPDTMELRTAAAMATVPAAWLWPPSGPPPPPVEVEESWLLLVIAAIRRVSRRGHLPDCPGSESFEGAGKCDCGAFEARKALQSIPVELRPAS